MQITSLATELRLLTTHIDSVRREHLADLKDMAKTNGFDKKQASEKMGAKIVVDGVAKTAVVNSIVETSDDNEEKVVNGKDDNSESGGADSTQDVAATSEALGKVEEGVNLAESDGKAVLGEKEEGALPKRVRASEESRRAVTTFLDETGDPRIKALTAGDSNCHGTMPLISHLSFEDTGKRFCSTC